MEQQLRKFQVEGIIRLGQAKNVLLADEPGLGKTIQCIQLIKRTNGRVLVVCPLSLKHNWLRECVTWGIDEKEISVVPDDIKPKAKIVIINYDLLIKYADKINSVSWQLVIYDEAHYIKNYKAKRTTAARKVVELARRKTPTMKTIFVTGTPILNRPMELLCLFEPLVPDLFPDWWKAKLRYCQGHKHPRLGCWIFQGSAHEEELRKKIAPYVIRRTKKEVLSELPPVTKQIIELGDTNNIVKEEFATFAENVAALGYEKAVDIAKIAKTRQEVGLAKVEQAIEHIANVMEEEWNHLGLVVFAWHKSVIAALEKGLKEHFYGKVDIEVITGDTPVEQRARIVDRFQNHLSKKILIGNIQAMGVGLTLTAANTVIFVESSFVPGEIDQAIDRLHRIGQEDNVRAQFLVQTGSIDAQILNTILRKQKSIDRILN